MAIPSPLPKVEGGSVNITTNDKLVWSVHYNCVILFCIWGHLYNFDQLQFTNHYADIMEWHEFTYYLIIVLIGYLQ